MPQGNASPIAAIHDALCRHDAAEVRRLLQAHAELRQRINDPLFAFNSPAIVAYAGDAAMVDVLLEAGCHGGTPLGWCCHGSLNGNRSHDHPGVARLLIAAGAVPGDETGDASAAVRAVLET